MFAVRTQVKSRWTITVEASDCVLAIPSIAVSFCFTFVNIFTYSRWSDIEARFTFALVSIGSVDAFASAADIGSENALVDLTQVTCFLAQLGVRIIADEGTLFTNATVAPSFAHVDAAAAVLPGQFDGQFVATLAVSTDRSETVAPSGIDAAFAILTGNESSIADAVVTAIGVDAGAICTDAFLLAFVRFAAFICFFIAFHTRWALALERANCVDALAAFAQRRYGLAFINIDALAAVDVAKKSFIAVEFGGTLLARMAPRFAHSGAAQLFGANHALQLALAHVVTYVGEARTCPVVSFAAASGVTVNASAAVGADTAAAIQTRLGANTFFAGVSGESRSADAFLTGARAAILTRSLTRA